MTPNNPTPALKRIREKAPHRRSVSLADDDILRFFYLEKIFTAIYTEEGPFSFSKTVSKSVDLAILLILDPKLRFEEEQLYQEIIQKLPPTSRRIRKEAPHRRSLSLTDEDIQKISDIEKIFTTTYTWEIPFSFSKTVSKAGDIATMMALDLTLQLDKEQEYLQELSEENREQLKHEIESGLLYQQNIPLFRTQIDELYKEYVAELEITQKLLQTIAELEIERKSLQALNF